MAGSPSNLSTSLPSYLVRLPRVEVGDSKRPTRTRSRPSQIEAVLQGVQVLHATRKILSSTVGKSVYGYLSDYHKIRLYSLKLLKIYKKLKIINLKHISIISALSA